MPARLQPGQPPLRVKEFAVLCGVATNTVRKWFKAGALDSVTMPESKERRIPVDVAVCFLRSLRVL